MSRGPGFWQRRILAALNANPAVYMLDLLPTDYSRAEYVALQRAARSLKQRGAIDVDRYMCFANVGARVVLLRCGHSVPRISVARLNTEERGNTYASEVRE